jgi:hypothetical protein
MNFVAAKECLWTGGVTQPARDASAFARCRVSVVPSSRLRARQARHGTVTPCSCTPDGFCVGSSSVCTFTVVGGIASITNGTLAGL